MQVEPGIHQLTIGREPFAGFPPPNASLLCGRESSVLIDAGYDDENDHRERMAYLEQAGGPPLSELIVTHRHTDHGGGAAAIHEATGAKLTCHPLDREAIEKERLQGRATIDEEVTGGETRDLGGLTLDIIHGPGHTPGCLAIFIRESGALIATDTVMQISTTVLRPGEGNLREYLRTLERFMEIDPKTIYTGHGGPATDPRQRLKELLEHRHEREQELLRELEAGPRTIPEIRAKLYVGLPENRVQLAEAQVLTGLTKLIEDGAAKAEGDRYVLA